MRCDIKALSIAATLLVLISARSHGEITLDGSMGAAGALAGPDYRITADLGHQSGANLFHSFGRFDILTGQSATFSGPDTIANVVSRVTGGEISTIDGLLRSEVGAADFYFINPAGIVFGPGARVDVPAAFHAGTADEVRFADGAVFSAIDTSASTLSAAAPESFGYLGSQAGDLVINGSQLEFASQSVVSLSGMDVTIQGDETADASLLVVGGELRISTVGDMSGAVPLNGELYSGTGKLEISHADIATSGDGGGAMRISAGAASVTRSRIAADNTGPTDALGGVDIRLSENMAVNASRIQTNTFGQGRSGGINIKANDLSIASQGAETLTGLLSEVEPGAEGQSGNVAVDLGGTLTLRGAVGIGAFTFGAGNAGDVHIHAKAINMDGQNQTIPYRASTYVSGIASEAGNGSTGHAGNLEIDVAGPFSVVNSGGISTSTHGQGDAGTMRINVSDLLEVINGGSISSDTFSAGNAGNVIIEAGHLGIDRQGSASFTGISSDASSSSSGNAGTVRISVSDHLEVVNGGSIQSGTFSQGHAGDVLIEAGSVIVDRQDSEFFTGIASQANSGSVGNAGTVAIAVGDLLAVLAGGQISCSTFATGNAGDLSITAGRIDIDGKTAESATGIFSAASTGSFGNAGKVDISAAGLLNLTRGGTISSRTSSQGNAGGVTIHAGAISIDRAGSNYYTGIYSDTGSESTGNAGPVAVLANGTITISGGATMISSNTSGTGRAGNITIGCTNLVIDAQNTGYDTGIFSNAMSGDSGDAGQISINVAALAELRNGGEISSDTSGEGHAGNVIIEAGGLSIDRQGSKSATGISSQANSGSVGNAGKVEMAVVDLLEVLDGGQISSSTYGAGDAGGVVIQAGRLHIDRQGAETVTGISSDAYLSSHGNAGTVEIHLNDLLEVINGGSVTSSTFSEGQAGNVIIEAGNLRIDRQGSEFFTGISSQANRGSGAAGTVNIKVMELLEVVNGGIITSSTFSEGQAGDVIIESSRLCIDRQGSASFTGITSDASSSSHGNAGTVRISAMDLLEVRAGGQISSSTYGAGDAGGVVIQTERLSIDRQGSETVTGILSDAFSSSQGNAGTVRINVSGRLEVVNGGSITSNTSSEGNAGNVIIAAGSLRIDRQGAASVTGISSQAKLGSVGNAGTVEITVGDLLEVVNGGSIASSTFSEGHAGDVMLEAGRLLIDGQGSELFTGIASQANSGSVGNAGKLEITVRDLLEVFNGGLITSDTYSAGHAGDVMIAAGRLSIDGQGSASFTGISSDANSSSHGNAGTVRISVSDLLEVVNGGRIQSDTYSDGHAGDVVIEAGRLSIDRQGSAAFTGISSDANSSSHGNAGTVRISVSDLLKVVNGGSIQSSTYSEGDAGDVIVAAGRAAIDGQGSVFATGISSRANSGSVGNAGKVEIAVVDLLEVLGGGQISCSTFANGDAGDVSITAGRIDIDGMQAEAATGVLSRANQGSLGNAGRVEINAAGLLNLARGGTISSRTYSEGDAGGVTIHAGELRINRAGSNYYTGIFSDTGSESTGNAGPVDVVVEGGIEIIGGAAVISSNTSGTGRAGSTTIESANLVIDAQDTGYDTGIFSNAMSSNSGDAGKITITVADLVELRNGGKISSDTSSRGNAGNVVIAAGRLRIDRQGSESVTGISSRANDGSVGNAGKVAIAVEDLLEVVNGATITSSTFSTGHAGDVLIAAGRLRIDGQGSGAFTGISSQANSGSSGNAGKVEIAVVDLLEVVDGGVITSDTYSEGHAGDVLIAAGTLRIDRQGSESATGISSDANSSSQGNAGTVEIKVSALLEVINGGSITSSTFSAGHAGDVLIEAGRLRIDRQGSASFTGISSQANDGSAGNAGKVAIAVGDLLAVLGGGKISSSTFGAGDAGGVVIQAGRLHIDRQGSASVTGISSDAQSTSQGNAGTVWIAVTDLLEVLNGGSITSDTFSEGHAGDVIIEAATLRIDRQGSESVTGISSDANSSSQGNAGTVQINVSALLEVINGGSITSSTFSDGHAGDVIIEAGDVSIDGRGSERFTGISSQANRGSGGDAGKVLIAVVDRLDVVNGGIITSSTFSEGHAGNVMIEAGNVTIDRQDSQSVTGISSQANSGSGGNAGMVTLAVNDLLEVVNGGVITSSTFSEGHAGNVVINAGLLGIAGCGSDYFTGISSQANIGSVGNAGTVAIAVDDLMAVLDGSQISSSTWGGGDAGDVIITAGDVIVAGSDAFNPSRIESLSSESALGLAGDVEIQAGRLRILDGGEISIASLQTVPEERRSATGQAAIHLNSTMLTLDQDARITAQSTGNAPAAAITIDSYQIELSGGSRITTSAVAANGGPIVIGADVIVLSDSLVTSSVDAAGDGGDITITGHSPARAVVLDGGFVQANAPAGARGGDIFIDAEALIAEPGSLEVGGRQRQVFMSGSGRNIIQAAAPGGEQGDIEITSPDLDISGSLVNLEARLAEPLRLADDPCQAAGETGGSALVRLGPGGVAAAPEQHGAVCFDGQRLDRLLRERKGHGNKEK